MTVSRRATLAVLFLAGCTPTPPAESVTLPPAGIPAGAGDPTRAAIISSAQAFADPASFRGDAATMAEVLAQLEYLTAELGSGGPWRDMDPLVAVQLRQAREETRAAFGLRPEASAQVAVNALYATAGALRANNRAGANQALAPLAVAGGSDTAIARFAAPPPLPRANEATTRARRALDRRDRGGNGRVVF